MNKIKYKSAIKSITYLLKCCGWDFENIEQSAIDFQKSFGYGDKNSLSDGIVKLLTKCKNWGFYSLKDIKSLDEARKIYRKNLLKYENQQNKQ